MQYSDELVLLQPFHGREVEEGKVNKKEPAGPVL
jgi:hypothetical protein